MNKQTSIIWYAKKNAEITIQFLEGKINGVELKIEKTKCLEQAKQMHQQEIEDAFAKGQESLQYKFPLSKENFYEETYGGNNEKI